MAPDTIQEQYDFFLLLPQINGVELNALICAITVLAPSTVALDADLIAKWAETTPDSINIYIQNLETSGILTSEGVLYEVDPELLQQRDEPKEEAPFRDKLISAIQSELGGWGLYRALLGKLLEENPDETFSQGWKTVSESLGADKTERQALLSLVKHTLEKGFVPLDTSEHGDKRRGYSRLIEKGLAIVTSRDSRDFDGNTSRDQLMLSPGVCRLLFRGDEMLSCAGGLGYSAEIIRADSIPERPLYYDAQIETQVRLLSKSFSTDTFDAVSKRLSARHCPAGITCLLHGAPGTGKTELAMQIARQTGRNLVMVDASKTTNSLCGESAKIIKEMFLQYRYLFAVSSTPPILVLNEADGILGRRSERTVSSADRDDNVTMSVFLNELERFEGLLIATTNLPAGLDSAFYRRFLFKIQIGIPSESTRAKIWRANMPSLPDADVVRLASMYRFTGGNITNVALKADIFEGIEGRAPGMQEIISFCEEENSLGQSESPKIYGKVATPAGRAS